MPDHQTELQLAHALVGALQIARLLPRGGHQRFLMLLHDARAERSDAALTRIEVQLIEPGRAPARDGRTRGMPSAVERRREQRVGVRIADQLFARRVDDRRELVLEGLLRIVRPRHASGASAGARPQRAFERERRAGGNVSAGKPKPGSLMSIGRLPSPAGRGYGRSRRTSDSKSPPSPVRNRQW